MQAGGFHFPMGSHDKPRKLWQCNTLVGSATRPLCVWELGEGGRMQRAANRRKPSQKTCVSRFVGGPLEERGV